MSDTYDCLRCGKQYEWEKMTATPEGNLFCPDCWQKLDPKNEARRKCPADGSEMKKQLVAGLVLIDKCSSCGGMWFDRDELKVIEDKWKDSGWKDGFVTGWLFG